MKANLLIVYRVGEKFVALQDASDALGLRPDAVWNFGHPVTPTERELWLAVQPMLRSLPRDAVHGFPTILDPAAKR